MKQNLTSASPLRRGDHWDEVFIFFLRQKPLHQWLFYLLILLLPTQLAKHFWFDFSLVRGIRIDYLAPTVYLTDLVVLAILVSWWWERWVESSRQQVVREKVKPQSTYSFPILPTTCYLLLISVLLNTLFAADPFLAVYRWLKVLELVFLGYYVSKNIGLLGYWVIGLLAVSVSYSSFLAWAQFINQGSIGGLWWFLGERTFKSNTPGIAQVVIDGLLMLRPYATFPHPNVLAGYLLVVLSLIFFSKTSPDKLPIIKITTLLLGIPTLFLTFSRSAWIVAGSLLIVVGIQEMMREKRLRRIHLKGVVFLLLFGLLGYWVINLFPRGGESLANRLVLNVAAVKMSLSSPLVGVGLGNFISRLPEFLVKPATVAHLQPVHNIYLLITAETGLVGLGLFLWFLSQAFQFKPGDSTSGKISNFKWKRWNIYQLLLVEILLIGFFDHYFATIQQTQLLFAIIGGMAWGSSRPYYNVR